MTTKRRDGGGTQFSNWLRRQPEIDSHLGYMATDIDYVWINRKKQKYMFLEEKRYGKMPAECQKRVFQNLHNQCKNDKRYCGFYYLVFENSSPDDGEIHLYGDIMNPTSNGVFLTKNELIEFLKFEFNPFSEVKI
jgi:hypothetical protein